MEGRRKRQNVPDRDRRDNKRPRKSEKPIEDQSEDDELDWCLQLYNDINDLEDPEEEGVMICNLFLQLPSKRLYPDYYQVIKHPIALSNMKAKIDKKQYTSVAELKSDIDQMVANAKKYNIKESQAYQDAIKIQKFVKSWQPVQGHTEEKSARGNASRPKSQAAERKAVLKLPGEAFGARISPPTENRIKAIRLKAVDKHAKKSMMKDFMSAVENRETKRALSILDEDTQLDPNQLVKAEMFNDTFTWSPLHAAAYYGDVKVCDALIKRGADVELQDTWYSATPLGWAAFGDKEKVARLLVEKYDADISAKNIHGQVPFDLVSDKDDSRWTGLFLEKLENDTKRHKTSASPPKTDLKASSSTGQAISKTTSTTSAPGTTGPPGVYMTGSMSRALPHGMQSSLESSQPPRKRRGRPPKSETENMFIRPTEEIDIDQFDPVGFMKEIFYAIRAHRTNTGEAGGRLYSEIFEELPERDSYPDYYEQIHDPRCLMQIEEIMRNRGYANLKEWFADMDLVFENAIEYNEPGSRVFKDAKLLRRLLYRLKERTFARESVPVSQEDEVMTIPLVDKPFYDDDRRRTKRIPPVKAKATGPTGPGPTVMDMDRVPHAMYPSAVAAPTPVVQTPQPFMPFGVPPHIPQNPIAAAAVVAAQLQSLGNAEVPLAMQTAIAQSTDAYASMAPHDNLPPSPFRDQLRPLTTASSDFYHLLDGDLNRVRLLDTISLIATDNSKGSFRMKLSGDETAHCLVIPGPIHAVRIFPQLKEPLKKEGQRLSIVVQQNNQKLDLAEENNNVATEPCWESQELTSGMHTIKIIVTANLTRTDMGTGMPEYKSQTYHVFVTHT